MGSLFGGLAVFSVPPFQRVFAWEQESVAVFLDDIERCYLKRRDDRSEAHFFGSIVTGPLEGSGMVRPHRQVLDGQQRLAMFALFIAALSDNYNALAAACEPGVGDIANGLRSRAAQVRTRYLVSEELDFTDIRDAYTVNLNHADDPFFKALLRGDAAQALTDSHRRLETANAAIRAYLAGKREAAFNEGEERETLNRLYRALVEDWELVHIEAGNAKQASQIFRVLNNRGVPVSASDLLRATTLEACHKKLEEAEFEELKTAWAQMTSLEKLSPDAALEIVQTARFPLSSAPNRTSTDFEGAYFPALAAGLPLANESARELLAAVKGRRDDFLTVEQLARGELVPAAGGVFSSVERSLFQSLLGELDQQWVLSALLASRSLDFEYHRRFLLDLTLFAFRYRVVCKGPLAPFERAMRRTIDQMNSEPQRFRIANLEEDLRELVADHANDDTFERALMDLTYTSDAKAIRFLLAMDEFTAAWVDEGGGRGRPAYRAPDQGIDLSSITLEHISAQQAEDVEPELQPLLHTIGNLTLLAEGENDRARNRSFEGKREILRASNLRRNGEIAALAEWTAVTATERQAAIINRAKRIFLLDHHRQ